MTLVLAGVVLFLWSSLVAAWAAGLGVQTLHLDRIERELDKAQWDFTLARHKSQAFPPNSGSNVHVAFGKATVDVVVRDGSGREVERKTAPIISQLERLKAELAAGKDVKRQLEAETLANLQRQEDAVRNRARGDMVDASPFRKLDIQRAADLEILNLRQSATEELIRQNRIWEEQRAKLDILRFPSNRYQWILPDLRLFGEA